MEARASTQPMTSEQSKSMGAKVKIEIKYTSATMDDARKAPTPAHLAGCFPGTNVTGYGAKITTIWKIPHLNRLYRVYATCFSNCASHWIFANGEKLHVRD